MSSRHELKFYMNKRALTLFEILVSVVILSLVITGLANVFVAGKKYMQHNRLRLTGGELGKLFLDPLQNDVRADIWSTTRLGTGSASAVSATIDNKVYNGTYDINTTNLPNNLTRVKVTVKWPAAE